MMLTENLAQGQHYASSNEKTTHCKQIDIIDIDTIFNNTYERITYTIELVLIYYYLDNDVQ